MVWTLLIILMLLMVLGFYLKEPMVLAPIITIMIFIRNIDPMLGTQQLVAGVSSFVLISVPMFILAADIMCAGQTANRLLDFVQTITGHVRGGMAITTAVACTLFGTISGSTQATVVVIGKPMINRLYNNGYKDKEIFPLIICAAVVSLLIPPSVSMIMYCVVSGTSVGDLFIAGITPGIISLGMICIYSYFHARRGNLPILEKVSLKGKGKALKKALGALGFPIIIFGGIYSGTFSPTEAAAIAVLYALIIEMFFFKTIKLKDLKGICISTAVVTSAVFILVAAGQLFSWTISYVKLPQLLTESVLGTDPSAMKVLIVTTIFFFIGCIFVDPLVAIIVLTPIFFPIALSVGIDPIHMGVIVTLQAAIGCVTPPLGCNIFTACAIFNKNFSDVVRGMAPYMIIFFIMSVMVIVFPQISLYLIK